MYVTVTVLYPIVITRRARTQRCCFLESTNPNNINNDQLDLICPHYK